MNPKDTFLKVLLDAAALPAVSRLVGRCADAPLPRPVLHPLLRAYVHLFGVDLGEAARDLPDYRSFDDFFTRRLQTGCRPIAPGEDVLVSPTDGQLAVQGTVHEGQLLQVKGQRYSLGALIGDEDAARRFEGGSYFTLYLSPRDYHRIHAPITGDVLGYRYIPGRFYPVNQIGIRRVKSLFLQNERLITHLRTAMGHVAVVAVGATSVGRISVTYDTIRTNGGATAPQSLYYARPTVLAKGEELGAFHLGSTVVLVIEPPALLPCFPDDRLPTPIRYGMPLAHVKPAKR